MRAATSFIGGTQSPPHGTTGPVGLTSSTGFGRSTSRSSGFCGLLVAINHRWRAGSFYLALRHLPSLDVRGKIATSLFLFLEAVIDAVAARHGKRRHKHQRLT